MAAGPEDGARADLEEDGFEIVSESGSVGGKSKTPKQKAKAGTKQAGMTDQEELGECESHVGPRGKRSLRF